LSDFVDVVRARHPGLPVFVLGESMGGAVAMTAFASDTPPKADGLILVAPAVWGGRAMPFAYRAILWLTAHSIGGWNLSGGGLKIMPSDNIAMLRANGRDPLFQKRARADAVYGMVRLMDEAYNATPRLKNVPLLFAYGGNDQIIPRAPTEEVKNELRSHGKVKFYPAGYHMLLRDLDHERRWADIANWIATRSRARAPVALSGGPA